jgi:hypothetical protein
MRALSEYGIFPSTRIQQEGDSREIRTLSNSLRMLLTPLVFRFFLQYVACRDVQSGALKLGLF